MASTESERFIRRAKAEYDGYLLIDDEYTKESLRIVYENSRDMNEEIEALKIQNNDLTARLRTAEINISNIHTH